MQYSQTAILYTIFAGLNFCAEPRSQSPNISHMSENPHCAHPAAGLHASTWMRVDSLHASTWMRVDTLCVFPQIMANGSPGQTTLLDQSGSKFCVISESAHMCQI